MNRVVSILIGLFCRWPCRRYLIPNHYPAAPKRWLGSDGKVAQWIRTHGSRYEINEFGQWTQIGWAGGEMMEARECWKKVQLRLVEYREVVRQLEADEAAMMASWPGCERSYGDAVAAGRE